MSLKVFQSKYKADIDRMLDEGIKPYLISRWLQEQGDEHHISKDSIYKYRKMRKAAQETQMELIRSEEKKLQPKVDVMTEIAKSLKKLNLLEKKGLQTGIQASTIKDLINVYKAKAELLRLALQLTGGKAHKDLSVFLSDEFAKFEGREEDESIEVDFRREFFGVRKAKRKKDKVISLSEGDTEGQEPIQDNSQS